jgi:hypothetical protein
MAQISVPGYGVMTDECTISGTGPANARISSNCRPRFARTCVPPQRRLYMYRATSVKS